jgi:TonB family protein
MNNKAPILYTPSGCLTSKALLLFVYGSLKGLELTQAQQHIAECGLCADAAEGLRMWMNENKSVDAIPSELMGNTDTDIFELAGNQPDPDKNRTPANLTGDFQARTDTINERVRQRLHAYDLIEKAGNNRLPYKPYVWLAAAATLLLFIGGGYILWMQTMADSKKLAQKPGINSAFNPKTFGTTGYEALPFPPSQSTSVLTINYDHKKSDKVPPVLAIVTEVTQKVASKNESSASTDDHVEYTKSQRSQASEAREEDYNESVYKRDHPETVVRRGGAAMKNEEMDDDSGSLYAFVNEMPSFPGGDTERRKFFSKHIRYPQYAAENDIQGNIVVGFIVKKDGSLANVKILHGIGGGCDEEALRVVKMMPPWKPGYQNGKKTNVLVTMPVYFKLQ